MSIVSMLFEQKRWLPQDILSYRVTGKPNRSGVAWVYQYDTVTDDLGRHFDDKDHLITLAHGTLLEVDTERRHYKDWNGNYQYFRKILKCPDYPMVVGDLIAESDITKVN